MFVSQGFNIQISINAHNFPFFSQPSTDALNLYDPFGFSKNKSEEAKAAGLIKELNNGRLAMLAAFGMISQEQVTHATLF